MDQDRVKYSSCCTAYKIEGKKFPAPPEIFQHRSEKVQDNHIKQNVSQAAMQELVCNIPPKLHGFSKGFRQHGEPFKQKYSELWY